MLRTRHGHLWRSASEKSIVEARMHVKARTRRGIATTMTMVTHEGLWPMSTNASGTKQEQRGRKSGERRLGRCSRTRGCCALRAINWGVRETNVVV
jgi:hypothetical protein